MRHVWDTYMGHVCDKYLYPTHRLDMYLKNTLYGAGIWEIYVTNTSMGLIPRTCIWKILYIGHLYGTCIC